MALNNVDAGLLKNRIIDLKGEMENEMADYVRECLKILKSENNPDIIVEISSGGGSVRVGLTIYDMLRLYPGKKTGKVIGAAHSMAAVVLQACNKRLCAKHAQMMIHHISQSSVSLDTLRSKKRIKETLDSMEEDQKFIYEVLCKSTGQNRATIKKVCSEEKYMTAEEAMQFGLVDKVI